MSTPAPSPSPAAPPADTGGSIGGLSMELIESSKPGFLENYNRWIASIFADESSSLTSLLTFIGVVMLVFSLVKIISAGRKNSSQYGKAAKDNIGMLIFTSMLLAPNVILPILVGIADFLGGMFIAIARTFGGG